MKMPIAAIAVLIACATSLLAQWPKFKEAGVPRDAQGRAVMDGRTPRTSDGKPDLSGDWMRADRDPLPQELVGVVTARGETNRAAPSSPRLRLFLRTPTLRLLLPSSTSAR